MATKPGLKPWNAQYVNAFYELSPSRSHSETPHPLSFSDIYAFGTAVGIREGDDMLLFYRMIRTCDDSYLTYHIEQRKIKQQAQQTK